MVLKSYVHELVAREKLINDKIKDAKNDEEVRQLNTTFKPVATYGCDKCLRAIEGVYLCVSACMCVCMYVCLYTYNRNMATRYLFVLYVPYTLLTNHVVETRWGLGALGLALQVNSKGTPCYRLVVLAVESGAGPSSKLLVLSVAPLPSDLKSSVSWPIFKAAY